MYIYVYIICIGMCTCIHITVTPPFFHLILFLEKEVSFTMTKPAKSLINSSSKNWHFVQKLWNLNTCRGVGGGNSYYCTLLDAGKAHYFPFGERLSLGAYTIMRVYRYRCVMLLYVWCISVTLSTSVSFIYTLCKNSTGCRMFFPSRAGPRPTHKKSHYCTSFIRWD
jgi:hypothetical protein